MAGVLARLSSRAVAGGLGVLLLVACSTGGSSNNQTASSTDVTVWTAWGGNELKAFQQVLKPFHDQTGITVHLTTVRDANQLSINVDAGTSLPDIAPGPSVDKVNDWVTKGVMKSVETALGDKFSDYIANTYPALTTATGGASDLYIGIVGGKHYELMVKTQVKGLFWYNKKVFTGTAPKTFDELLAINPAQYGAQKLFCAGLESGGASGWPASDQIDNIIMRQSGSETYTKWIQGKVKFSDPAIKLGYQTYLKEVSSANVYGGPNTVLSTAFQRAGKPLFAAQPGCLFLEQATFIPSFFLEDYPNLKAGVDFDFFGHPSVVSQYDGNVNGFYDQFAMYNDTPAARKLMQYMATAPAQQIWADAGGTLAAIKSIKYNDPVFARAAEVAGGAKNLLVTAGDFMPSDMQAAFWKSLLNVTRNPGSLDSELAKLDQVQAAAYKTS
jgi:alpha-glucoside transport system substrate-binding protein